MLVRLSCTRLERAYATHRMLWSPTRSVGNAGRDEAAPDTSALSAGNKSLTGVSLALEMFAQPARVRPMVAQHLADVASGGLTVVIDRVFPLAEAAAAHAHIESPQAFGRVLLAP